MKRCHIKDQSKIEVKLLNYSMLEDHINLLKTTRSCPTGYNASELRETSTVELLYLRKTTYEYLNLKALKTRNAQFIRLVERINRELESRKVNIPISKIETITDNSAISIPSFNKGKIVFDEVNHYIQTFNQAIQEYCYLTHKRRNTSIDQMPDDSSSMILCNSHFTISNQSQRTIPQFLQDCLPQIHLKEQQSNDFELFSQLTREETSKFSFRNTTQLKSKQIKGEVINQTIICEFVNKSINLEFDTEDAFLLYKHK